MKRLFEVGFKPVGYWRLDNAKLCLELDDMIEHSNVLYAFVSADEVLYVGKTTKTLRRRMAWYLRPSATQSTNVRNNASIVRLLEEGKQVDILALPDVGLHRFGEFKINFAAALEDSIIGTLAPPWNGARRARVSEDDAEFEGERMDSDPVAVEIDNAIALTAPAFPITLQRTYYRTGFFNVPTEQEHLFGAGGRLDIYCGRERVLIQGRYDRKTNTNGTPRVFGYTMLRDWFRQNLSEMQKVRMAVLSPTSIEVTVE